MNKKTEYVWFEKSKGPADIPGFDLRHLQIDPHNKDTIWTPSFGWWCNMADFMNDKPAAMRSITRTAIEEKYNLLWIHGRPDSKIRDEFNEIRKLENCND